MMTPSGSIPKPQAAATALDVEAVRKDFPLLHQEVNGYPLAYFDNAATSQKPEAVLQALDNYYRTYNSNVHRGVHYLSEQATTAWEKARKTVAAFIHAPEPRTVNFTKGTTDAVNLVAFGYGEKFVKQGDEIIISQMEHHSNLVPWQMLCERKGARLRVIPVNEQGELVMEEYAKLLNKRTKLVAVSHVSNALGTVNPVDKIIAQAHAQDIPVLLDGAQAAPHLPVDVQNLDCDFFCFSGHKVCGPTGIGVLYGKARWLEEMWPYQGGGEMIEEVTLEKTTYNELPYKYEAGTPNIAGGIGLAAALDYVSKIGMNSIAKYEKELVHDAVDKLRTIPKLRFIGEPQHRTSVISFLLGDTHPYDLGILLDKMGIAVRTGHHCCQPLMNYFGIEGTCRASLAFYNTTEELDRLVQGIDKAGKMLG